MKSKQYKIKTVQDMIDCTNGDNIDNFMIDLRAFLITTHSFRYMANLIGEIKGVSKEKIAVESDGFIWIDDGKHKIKVGIK